MVLLWAPWSVVWERNVFVELLPFWRDVIRLDGVRGAVSGVGLVSLGIGFWELAALLGPILRRRGRRPGAGVERTLAEEAGSWSVRKP